MQLPPARPALARRRSFLLASLSATTLGTALSATACTDDPGTPESSGPGRGNGPATPATSPTPDVRGWTVLPAPPLQQPVLRAGQAAVWTGRQVLIWGGCTPRKDGCAVAITADGAAWTPSPEASSGPGHEAGSWTAMAPAPLQARSHAQLWWTGTAAVLIGGQDPWAACEQRPAGRLDVASFTPGDSNDSAGSWQQLPNLPWPAGTTVAASAWTGDTLGDTTSDKNAAGDATAGSVPRSAPASSSGRLLAWAPAVGAWSLRLGEDTWTPLPSLPLALPTTAGANASVRSWWTGSHWLITGTAWLPSTTGSESSVDVGLAYDPLQDRWDVIDPGPLTGFDIDAVWSGARLFAFDPASGLSSFDPATNSWTSTAPGPLDDIGATSPDGGPALAWTGTEVFIWGGARKARDTSRCIDGDPSAFVYGQVCNPPAGLLGAAYNATTNTWRPIPDGPLQRRAASAVVWTGHSVFLAGGIDLEERRDGTPPPFPDHPDTAVALFTPSSM